MDIKAKQRLDAASAADLDHEIKALKTYISSIDKARDPQDKITALEEVINQAKAAIRTCERLEV